MLNRSARLISSMSGDLVVDAHGCTQIVSAMDANLTQVTLCYTACMLVKVTRLRRAGKPRSDRDVSADPGTRGEFSLDMVAGVAVAKIYAEESWGNRDPLIPELYRAKLMSAHGDGMRLRGFENGSEPIPQEWSMRFVRD
jgi:hypothetical protein